MVEAQDSDTRIKKAMQDANDGKESGLALNAVPRLERPDASNNGF